MIIDQYIIQFDFLFNKTILINIKLSDLINFLIKNVKKFFVHLIENILPGSLETHRCLSSIFCNDFLS